MSGFRLFPKLAFATALSLAASLAVFAQADGLASSTGVGSITAGQFNQRLKRAYPSAQLPALRGRLDLYKVTYRSRDAKGANTVLSGLVVLPAQGAPNGLVVFNHGTIVQRKAAPSFYRGEDKASEQFHAINAFGSGGYAIAMPDYIGLGDHKGAHPFPANVTNARAGMDLIKPARAVARRNNVEVGPQLFVTGYSEGGGVAMAQTRLLEGSGDPEHSVTASTPAAGPYDLSGSTLEFMTERGTDQTGFVVRTYLLGYMVHSLHKNQGIKIVDYFKPAMTLTINAAYGGAISDENVLKRIGLTGVLMRSRNDLFNVTTDRFRRVAETRDPNDPIIRFLKANDTYDWSPRNRMLLINLEGDQVVSPRNTQVAIQTMRRRGVGHDMLRRSVIRDAKLNHITAVPESLLRARLFFDQGFRGVRDSDEN